MIVLDAFAVIALARNEPAANAVAELIADSAEPTTISAVNLAEVTDHLLRVLGFPVGYTLSHLRLLRASGLDVLFVDDVTAENAGRMRARYYSRRTDRLSLADCVALATARREAAGLATADAALARAARAEELPLVALPDSSGNRPAAG